MAGAAALVDGVGQHVEANQPIRAVDERERKYASACFAHLVGIAQVARPRISEHVLLCGSQRIKRNAGFVSDVMSC
jgi:hypothetical protein